MSILGAFTSCVFAITIPSVYYAVSINETQSVLTIEAAFLAKSIEKIIQARPDLWEFENIRLLDIISQPSVHGGEDEREIRTAAGKLVVKNDFTEKRPIMSVSATFFDSGWPVGSIVARHSIRTQIIKTVILGILSSLLGFLIYFIFRTYPIRKLENTLSDLQWEKKKYEITLNAIGDGIISVSHKGKILFINRTAGSFVGMDASEAVGRQLEEVYVLRQHQENQTGEKGGILTGKGGNEYAIEEVRTPLAEMGADKCGVVISFRNITDRKRAEKALRESGERYRTLFDEVQDGICLADAKTGLIIDCNQALAALVCREREELIGQPQTILHPPQDDKTAFSPTFTQHLADKEGQILETQIVTKTGEIREVEIKAIFLDIQGRKLLQGLFHDITKRKKAAEELQRTLESLRKAFGATIQVMVSAVEARDPYTSGHQIRSADIARSIAMEMGLPQEKIDGIRMAGSIHDIGKLSIPAEILSKPTKLTELEFSLIKEHAQKGYEMLTDVESPWPLAQIVYQHHERMNGSGYPRNLKGEEMLIEARILAVADVVEAMASYRPYRPALGIDAALEEIEKNRGLLYDGPAVDACLRVFREKGYQIEGT
jgi:PAS domain S-box-containing protein